MTRLRVTALLTLYGVVVAAGTVATCPVCVAWPPSLFVFPDDGYLLCVTPSCPLFDDGHEISALRLTRLLGRAQGRHHRDEESA